MTAMPQSGDGPSDASLLADAELAERRGDIDAAAAAFAVAAGSEHMSARARALVGLGRIAWRRTRLADALEHYVSARALAQELNALDILAEVENGIGAILYARGEYERARTAFRASLALSTDDTHRAKVALNLAVLANIAGDHADAEHQYRQSLEAFRRIGDGVGEAMALHNLAMLHADRREWDIADKLFAECLIRAEAAGNRQLVADTLLNRSEVLCGKGEFETAITLCEYAIAIHRETGDSRGRGEALRWQGHAFLGAGDPVRAEGCLTEAHRIARALKNVLLEAEVARELGALAEWTGDLASARAYYHQAQVLFVKLGAVPDVEELSAHLARMTSADAPSLD